MSRGPGKWQRLILEAVEEHGAVWVNSLIPANATRSEHVALLRASMQLTRRGMIDSYRWAAGGINRRRAHTSAHRVGYNPERKEIVYVLNKSQIDTSSTLNHEAES